MDVVCSYDELGYKFTGKERDTESGLDNFGKRYNASALGRFMTPDPIGIMKQKLRDPQQWNMYSYVRNNPLRFVDPTGMYTTSCTQTDISKCDQNTQNLEKLRQAALASKDDKVVAAAKAYGAYGEKNGVAVAFSATDKSNVTFSLDAAGKATGVNVTLNSRVLSAGVADSGDKTGAYGGAVSDVAHEGSHVQTDRAFLAHQFDPLGAAAFDVSSRESEIRAYSVQNSVLNSMGDGAPDPEHPGKFIDLSNEGSINRFLDSGAGGGQQGLDQPIYQQPNPFPFTF
jgi:RHS repeat-associated protein